MTCNRCSSALFWVAARASLITHLAVSAADGRLTTGRAAATS